MHKITEHLTLILYPDFTPGDSFANDLEVRLEEGWEPDGWVYEPRREQDHRCLGFRLKRETLLRPKPCPFCGCEYEKDDDDYWWCGSHEKWCPLSAEGGYSGNILVPDDPGAIESWNRRAADENL